MQKSLVTGIMDLEKLVVLTVNVDGYYSLSNIQILVWFKIFSPSEMMWKARACLGLFLEDLHKNKEYLNI